MRFSFAILAAVVASASASSLYPRQAPTIPECATTCLASADTGDCAQNDNACLCKNAAFVKSTTECIIGACTGDDLTAATAGAQAICAGVGVTLAPPAPTGTGAANGTAAPSPTTNGTSGAPAPSGTTNGTAPGTNGTSTNGTSTNGTNTNSTGTGAGPAPSSGAVSNTLSSIAGVAALGLAALVL